MSKNLPRLPQGPERGKIIILGATDDWQEIEGAYGQPLPQDVRDLISLANLYLFLQLPSERSAPRADDGEIEKKIRDLRNRAETLRAELFSNHHWAPLYTPANYQELERSLQSQLALELREYTDSDEWSLLRFSLGAVIGSCDGVLKSLSQPDRSIWWDGQTYKTWIALIRFILEARGLPTGVSSDQDANRSPFVSLIGKLQEICLSDKAIQSQGALAKAIMRARNEVDFTALGPRQVEDFIYALLGADKNSASS